MSAQDELFNCVKSGLTISWDSFSRVEGGELERIDATTCRVDHSSEIFIYGTDLTLRVQIFYLADIARSVLGEERSNHQIADFFNEICNLTAGAVKKTLDNFESNSAISLPVSFPFPSSFELDLAKEAMRPLPDRHTMKLKMDEKDIFFAVISYGFHDDEFANNFKFVESDEDEDDVEFF